jgi:hypothetical protein
MFKTLMILWALGLAILALGLAAAFAPPPSPEILAQHAAQQAKVTLKKQAADYETELYMKSPDGQKIAARVILGAQFPGWCDWSSAVMIVHSNGEVFVRCNGDFGVDTTRRVAMRLK